MKIQKPAPNPVPNPLAKKMKSIVSDGKVTHQEYKDLKKIVSTLNASESDKKALLEIVNKAKNYTNTGLFSDGVLENKEMAKLQKLAGKLDSSLADDFLSAFKATAKPTKNNSILGSIFKSVFSIFKGGNQSSSSSNQVTSREQYPTKPVSPKTQFPQKPSVPPKATPVSMPSSALGTATTRVPMDFSSNLSGEIYQKSPHHDPNKFVPDFAMTAYHESGAYRSKSDPYAVGAITKPSKSQDLGGKTYGTYQFESSVYANGSTSGKSKVQNSTLMRFVNSPNNPYGKELQAAAQAHGVGSPEFDAKWLQLSLENNKAFGEAQQAFLHEDKAAAVEKFMDAAELSPEVRKDPRIRDLIMGSTNHVGGLAKQISRHLAQLQSNSGRKLTANEVGKAITEFKQTKVAAWFRSSPGAQAGVMNRFKTEEGVFA